MFSYGYLGWREFSIVALWRLTIENVADAQCGIAVEEASVPNVGMPFLSYEFLKGFYNKQKARGRKAKSRTYKRAAQTDTLNEKEKALNDLLRYRGIGAYCRRMVQCEAPHLQEMVSIGLCRSATGARSMAYRSKNGSAALIIYGKFHL